MRKFYSHVEYPLRSTFKLIICKKIKAKLIKQVIYQFNILTINLRI